MAAKKKNKNKEEEETPPVPKTRSGALARIRNIRSQKEDGKEQESLGPKKKEKKPMKKRYGGSVKKMARGGSVKKMARGGKVKKMARGGIVKGPYS